MADKRDKLRTQSGVTPPGITDLMARLANGVQAGNLPAVIETLHFSKTGLVIDRELTQGEWLELRQTIHTIKQAYQWIVGDWMLYGFEREWSTTYEDMAALAGLKDVTVKNYTYVCRNVVASLRSDKLSFAHFQLIAPLPDDDKPKWIQRAMDEKMSVRDLRKAINNEDPDPPPPLRKEERQLLTRVLRHLRNNTLDQVTGDDAVILPKVFEHIVQMIKSSRR